MPSGHPEIRNPPAHTGNKGKQGAYVRVPGLTLTLALATSPGQTPSDLRALTLRLPPQPQTDAIHCGLATEFKTTHTTQMRLTRGNGSHLGGS